MLESKRIISLLLCCVMILAVFSGIAVTTFAASISASLGYDQPEDSGDYAYWNGSKVVKSSSTTVNEVKWMQAAINYCISKEGLSATKLTVDGSFGPASKKATIAFQKAAGLTADGSFGPSTIKKMKSILNDGKNNSLSTNNNVSKTAKYNLCWPVSTSVANYKRITSSLGNRNDPISGEKASHKGIDIGIPTGSSVLATYSGVVKFVGSNSVRGKYVVIYHADIGLTSVYQHLSSYSVKAGQTVSKGQAIAKSGSTGKSTGPHLHFELVVSTKAPTSVDCAWASGAKLIDGHYDSNLINYTYSK